MCLAAPHGAWAQPQTVTAESNGVRLNLTRHQGLSISVDNVPFSQESRLYVVDPKWTTRFFGWEDYVKPDEDVVRESLPGGGTRLTVSLEGKEGIFKGREIIELTPDRRLRFSVEGQLPSGQDGVLENRWATLQPGWIVGRDYRSERAGESGTTRTAPLVAVSEDLKRSKLAEGFTTLTVDSRLGPLTVTTSGTVTHTLVDYRKNKWAAGKLYYWLGVLDTEITGGKPFSYEVTIQFPPESAHKAGGEQRLSTGPVRVADALQPEIIADRILPTPKSVEWLKDDFPFTNHIDAWVEVTTGSGAMQKSALLDELHALASTFRDDVKARFGKSWEIGRSDYGPGVNQLEWSDIAVRLEDRSKRPPGATSDEWYRLKVHGTTTETLIKTAGGFEAYGSETSWTVVKTDSGALRVPVSGTVELTAETTAGIAHGLKTLSQLIRSRDGKLFIRGCRVEDYPSFSFRGIHFFTGKDARALQSKMLREVLGPLKINQLVYQADYLRWESMPAGSHNPMYVMEKDDARSVGEEARRQGIEVIPLVNTFGHSEWLIDNPILKHLADNPEHPYSYDPSNPEVYRLAEKIYEEAIELFRPRVFHIGHDEVTMHDFPHSERNKAIGASKLIIRDTLHYYNWLKERGLRTAMWGDMLLGPTEAGPDACLAPSDEEAQRRRAALPRDILLTDWHYEGAPIEKFTSLQLLSREGFDTVASTWSNAANVVRFAKVAESLDVDDPSTSSAPTDYRGGTPHGLLQTTWAGYSFDEKGFLENPDQYSAYVLAAEAAWNGGYPNPEDVPYDYRTEFVRLWNRSDLPAGGAAGWTVDLNGAANLDLALDANGKFLGMKFPEAKAAGDTDTTGSALFAIKPGLTQFDRFRFRIAGEKETPKAVLLSGQLNPADGTSWPKVLTVPVDAKASAVQFALAASFGAPTGIRIAETEIVYSDGTAARIPWKLEQTIFALDDPRATPTAPVLWQRKPRSEQEPGAAVHGYLWQNPSPEKPIREIVFRSDERGSALMLFGVTGIEK